LAITAIVTVGMQLSFFAIAFTCKFDKVTDIAGAMNFLLVAFLTFFARGTYHARQILLLCLDATWGCRLGFFLLRRVLKRGKDERFDQMRENFFSFLGFWVFQMVWVWLTSLSIIFVNAAPIDVSLGARDIVGVVFWGIGFIFEAVGDYERNAWNDNPVNKGKLLSTGTWSVTRHPNYFGEITMWLGIFISASSVFDANDKAGYVAVLSPVFTYFILMYASGVKMSEVRYNQRYGKDAAYLTYRERVSPLIPMPQCVYSSLPRCAKWIFCEYAIFAEGLGESSPLTTKPAVASSSAVPEPSSPVADSASQPSSPAVPATELGATSNV